MMLFCGIISYIRNSRHNKRYSFLNFEIWLPIVIFAIIFGLRYDVGQDHLFYLRDYESGQGLDRYEFFFKSIASNFRHIGLHFFWYFSLWALIQVSFVYYALNKEKYLLPFVVLPLILGQYYFQWMNTIRQDTAACIFFFMVNYIIDRKCLKYYLWCFILLGFHKSSIILFLLYPILVSGKDYTLNRFIQLSLFIVSFVIVLAKIDLIKTFLPFLSDYIAILGYDNYSENVLNSLGGKTRAGDGWSVRLLFLINMAVIIYSDKLKKFYNNRKFIIVYNLGFWGAFFQQLCTNNLAFARPFRFFKLFTMLSIAYLLFYLYKNGGSVQNVIVFFVIIIFMILMFVATIINEPFYFFWDIL